jgi:hypothetical protein
MADQPPISTEVPETVTVDTGADSKSLGDLNTEFADFWKEQDSGTESVEPAPAAPGEPTAGPAQQTKETKETKEPRPEPVETKPVQPIEPKAPEPKEITDEEINRMTLPPDAHPRLVDDFKNVKNLWLKDRVAMKAEREKAAKLDAELAEARKNSWTPEQKADYEHAASIRRRFDFVSDPEFIQKYHAPVRSKFEGILNEAIQSLPDKEAAVAWANHIAQNYQPDQLSRDWWLNSVIAKVPNELDRAALLNSVTDLIKTQRERDTEIHRRTQDKSSFENWITEKTNTTAARVQEEIMSEIGEQEKRIGEVLPRDPEAAKTAEERSAIVAHNERFTKLNNHFVETMKDISSQGPRAWVRASVQATRAMYLDMQLSEAQEELKSLRAERDQYKSELDKIAGARRRISHTSGTPPASSTQKKNGSLSIKDLDVRKALDNYDWGDTNR